MSESHTGTGELLLDRPGPTQPGGLRESLRRLWCCLLTNTTSTWLTGGAIFLTALVLRLTFLAVTASTFDPDEFVLLTFSRSVAHGAVPYRDFVFFHPPGMLVMLAGVPSTIARSWPTARILVVLMDSLTAALVWRMGRQLFDSTHALVAGLLYACSPLALVTSVRVGPDPVLTAWAALGLCLLLVTRSRWGAAGAGVCLAMAVWTKYTAVLFVVVYVLASPRRAWIVGLSCVTTSVGLFLPVLAHAHAAYVETVLWQLVHRQRADLLHRFSAVGGYWLLLNPLAAIALVRRRWPAWLVAGFCSGAAFLFTSQAYYHYFAIVVPFAALAAAPLGTSLLRRSPRLVALGVVALVGVWAVDVAYGSPPLRLFVASSRLSDVQQTAAALDRLTPPHTAILVDHFEYAVFAHRPLATDYFWDMTSVVKARTLERRVPSLAAIVQTRGDGFPRGFSTYLERRRYERVQTATTTIWVVRPSVIVGSRILGRSPVT